MIHFFHFIFEVLRQRAWLTIILLLLSAQFVHAQDETQAEKSGVIAETVWVEPAENEAQILYRNYVNGQWSDQDTVIYKVRSSIITPFLSTLNDGSKLLVWSELRAGSQMVLMQMRGALDSESVPWTIKWSSPQLLSDMRSYNSAAVVVIDLAGYTHVFWASEGKSDSDIFHTVLVGGEWSTPEMVNEENAVPDISPSVKLSGKGNLEVSWSFYSLESSAYLQGNASIESLFVSENERVAALESLEKRTDLPEEKLPVPSFLPSRSQLIRVHYPENPRLQYVDLN